MQQVSSKELSVSPKLLISLYCVVPLTLLVMALDRILFDYHVRDSLPRDPRAYAWFAVFFMLPHIFAGFFSFADKEYLHNYKSLLLRGAQVAVILGIFTPALLGFSFIPLLIFALYTMIHVFAQQGGISKILMKNSSVYHRYWQWLGIVISASIYIYLLAPSKIPTFITGNVPFMVIGALILTVYCILGLLVVTRSRTVIGSAYFVGVHCTPIAGLLYLSSGYYLFILLVPRIVHDVTAFAFYITHDANRHSQSHANYIYRLSAKVGMPVYVISPALSIALTYLVLRYNTSILTALLGCIFFMHYYIESFIWKSGTLHRKYLRVS